MNAHVRLRLLLLGHVVIAIALASIFALRGPRPSAVPWYWDSTFRGFLTGHVAVVAFACVLRTDSIRRSLCRVAVGFLYAVAILAWPHWELFHVFGPLNFGVTYWAHVTWYLVLSPALVLIGTSAALLAYQRRAMEIVAIDEVRAPVTDYRPQLSLRALFVGIFITAGILTLVRVVSNPDEAITLLLGVDETPRQDILITSCEIVSAILIIRACLTLTRPAIWTVVGSLAALAIGSVPMLSDVLPVVLEVLRGATERAGWRQLWPIFMYLGEYKTGMNLAHVLTLVVTFLLVRWCGYRFVPRSWSIAETPNPAAHGV